MRKAHLARHMSFIIVKIEYANGFLSFQFNALDLDFVLGCIEIIKLYFSRTRIHMTNLVLLLLFLFCCDIKICYFFFYNKIKYGYLIIYNINSTHSSTKKISIRPMKVLRMSYTKMRTIESNPANKTSPKEN